MALFVPLSDRSCAAPPSEKRSSLSIVNLGKEAPSSGLIFGKRRVWRDAANFGIGGDRARLLDWTRPRMPRPSKFISIT